MSGYIRRDGVPVVDNQRHAGNTLIIERDKLLVRVEGQLSRDRALELADSITVSRNPP